MTRPLTPEVGAALGERVIRDAYLCFFDFAGGAVYVWSGIGDLDYGGNTYQGVGTLGGVSRVGETSKLEGRGMSFRLSGVPSALIQVVLGEHYMGRRCSMHRALLDEDFKVINDPIPVFAGRMDTVQIDDTGEEAVITLNAESRFIDLRRFNVPQFYTDADQQAAFPGDVGFQYVEAMQDKVIQWGRNVFRGAPAPGAAGTPADGPTVSIPAPEGGQGSGDAGPSPDPSPDPGVSV